MPVLMSTAIAEAQLMLNDVAATKYTTAVLLPYLRKAYEEFQSWGDSFGLQTVKRDVEVAPTTVTGNYISITYTGAKLLPPDLRIPLKVYEKPLGSDPINYSLMEETEFKTIVSNAGGRTTYGYWAWDGQIMFFPKVLPAGNIDILIEYIGSTISFTDQTSTVYDIHFKTHLAARTAALAAMYIGQNETRAAACNDDANQALDRINETMVRQQQGFLGVRRIPFGTRRRYKEAIYKFR